MAEQGFPSPEKKDKVEEETPKNGAMAEAPERARIKKIEESLAQPVEEAPPAPEAQPEKPAPSTDDAFDADAYTKETGDIYAALEQKSQEAGVQMPADAIEAYETVKELSKMYAEEKNSKRKEDFKKRIEKFGRDLKGVISKKVERKVGRSKRSSEKSAANLQKLFDAVNATVPSSETVEIKPPQPEPEPIAPLTPTPDAFLEKPPKRDYITDQLTAMAKASSAEVEPPPPAEVPKTDPGFLSEAELDAIIRSLDEPQAEDSPATASVTPEPEADSAERFQKRAAEVAKMLEGHDFGNEIDPIAVAKAYMEYGYDKQAFEILEEAAAKMEGRPLAQEPTAEAKKETPSLDQQPTEPVGRIEPTMDAEPIPQAPTPERIEEIRRSIADIDAKRGGTLMQRLFRGVERQQLEKELGDIPIQPPESTADDTRAEWFAKLRDTIRQFPKNVAGDIKTAGKGVAYVATNPLESLRAVRTGAERATAYAKYFTDRSVSLDVKGEKLKTDLKAFTEGYNKLPFRQKAYITAALIGGGAVAATAGLPTLSSIFAGGMYTQRVLGGAGFALNRRKGMDARIAKNPKHWLAQRSDSFKDAYAAGLGIAYMGASAVAGRYATEKVTEWLGNMFGHGTAVATEVASPPNGIDVTRPITEASVGAGAPPVTEATTAMPEVPKAPSGPAAGAASGLPENLAQQQEVVARLQASGHPEITMQSTPEEIATALEKANQALAEAKATAAEAATAPVAFEMPTVNASSRGYEGMLKDLIKQLPEKPPAGITAKVDGTDIEKLFYAKMHPETVDGAIHRLATEHGFFNAAKPDTPNIFVDQSAKLTIVDGNLHFTDATHRGGLVNAVEGMRATPPAHQPGASGMPYPIDAGLNVAEDSVPASDKIDVKSQPVQTVDLTADQFPHPPGSLDMSAPAESATRSVAAAETAAPAVEQSIPRPQEGFLVDSEGNHVQTQYGVGVTTGSYEPPPGTNIFGINVPPGEPHIYADAGAKELFVYGGSPAEKAKAILEYLSSHKNDVVYGSDNTGSGRIPYYLDAKGELAVGEPVRKSFLERLFSGNPWMEAPTPNELAKIIK